jgi:phage shock protein A
VANIFVAASATWNGKALKKAKQDVGVFDKQVKRLGGTLAAAFSTRAIIRFGKESVKAFMADEKAAKSLEQQLKNTGFQFSSPAVELYIANLQKATGVLDDELRPAFQQLLTVTGSITTSQDALNTAMNVSAATGRSLSQVTTALSRAYAGNTTGLSRLGAGLDKALLKAGDMDAIMAELNNKFSGQAAARLETYAGKMDLLKVASENVKEEIGKGILDALALLGKDKGIETATGQMEDFGTSIGNAIYGMGKLIDKVNDLGVVSKAGGLGNILLALQPGGLQTKMLLSSLSRSGARPRELPANEQRSAGRISAQQFRVEVRQKKELDKLRALEIAALKKKTAVDELAAKFDVERIGFQKALNEATDEETKLRIKAQLAILDNNEALAKKILEEMKAADAAKKLGDALEASADKYDKMISGLIGQFRALGLSLQESMALAGMSARYQAQADAFAAGRGPSGAAPLSTDPYDILIRQLAPELNTQYGLPAQEAISLAHMSARYQAQADAITLRIDASGDKMSQAIAESIQQATRNGYSISGAGQLP